ncbi:uncharacterized protein [Procambarus clarkii]|uniref:uncharacterized protein n=1 Tax=Procambarus clarkii TaxID=6728 RepID=UPI001E676E66|nr:uncharacterized protein LOC123773336 [Procambarus clarkii]XP_045622940.1 uncharacterized protein LOC123773336 [Procambarus clarkii]
MAGRTSSLTAVVLGAFLVMTAVGERPEEQQQQERHSPSSKSALSNKFVGVTSKCSRGSLTVEVRTEESFSGSVYARGYPSRCRVMGTGTTITSLTVPAQKCGVKVIDDELGHHTYELLVYIQFDKWVQQVIDEQVHIRCKLDRNAGELQAAAQMSVVNKDALTGNERRAGRTKDKNNSIAAIVTAASSNRAFSSSSSSRGTSLTTSSVGTKQGHLVSQRHKNLSLRNRAQGDPMKDWQPVSTPPELLLWQSQRPEGNLEPVSCWMDIVAGKNMDGKPVLDFLLVGDDTTMVLKVRQSPGLDTRITSCVAHDGSGDQSQELIDEHGCAIDDDIMPPLRIKNNLRTGVKVAYASFKAFKFPDRDNLHLRCVVLVCLGSCSLPVCGRTTNRVGRRLGGPGEGSIQPILDIEEAQPAQLKGSRGNDRALASRLLDRVEVFNSVEVRAPGIESQPDLVKQYRIDREPTDSVDFFSDENMFCVTPYKMILAFGVLLAVLLLALLSTFYSCVKARVTKARLRPPQPVEVHRHSPVTSPYYRFAH